MSSGGLELLLRALLPLGLFALTGSALLALLPGVGRDFPETLDRLVLGLFVGAAASGILLFLLAALLPGVIRPAALVSICAAAVLAASLRQRLAWLGRIDRRQLLVASALAVLLFIALSTRLVDVMRLPELMANKDPYRHHVWTRAVMESGELREFAPLVYGARPELSFQLAYLLSALVGQVGGIDAWTLWRSGAAGAGAVAAVLGGYVLGRHGLGDRPLAGIFCAMLLCALPLHILRTRVGFSEAWALPFLPASLLFYLRFLARERLGDALLWALCFTTLIGVNMQNGVTMAPIFAAGIVATRLRRPGPGLLRGGLLALGFFLLVAGTWKVAFFPPPVMAALIATGKETSRAFAAAQLDLGALFEDSVDLPLALAGLVGIALALRDLRHRTLMTPSVTFVLGAFVFVPALLLLAAAAGLPSFTSRPMRYLMPAGHALAVFGAAGLWRIAGALPGRGPIAGALVAALVFVGLPGALGTRLHWGLAYDRAVVMAAWWTEAHTEPDDIVVSSPFVADLVRSVAGRHTIASTELREAWEHLIRMVPALPLRPVRTLEELRTLAAARARVDARVYVLQSRLGPFLELAGAEGVHELARFGAGEKVTRLYVLGDPPAPSPLQQEARPLVSDGVLRPEALVDGDPSTDAAGPSAETGPAAAWFGLEWPAPRAVRGLRAHLGRPGDPSRSSLPLLRYAAAVVQLEARRDGAWQPVPGTRRTLRSPFVRFEFPEALTADALRLHVLASRSDSGERCGRRFRAAVSELEVISP